MYKLSGFDDCIIGITAEKGEELRLVYSIEKVVLKIKRQAACSYQGAYQIFRELLEGDEDYELPIFVEKATIDMIEQNETQLQIDLEALNAGEIH